MEKLMNENNEWIIGYWLEKCMEYEAQGSRPRGRPKRTWREAEQKDCQTQKLTSKYSRWRKLMKDD